MAATGSAASWVRLPLRVAFALSTRRLCPYAFLNGVWQSRNPVISASHPATCRNPAPGCLGLDVSKRYLRRVKPQAVSYTVNAMPEFCMAFRLGSPIVP